MIPAILMHAAFNTSGKYFAGIFRDAQPGQGGFLVALLNHLPAPAGGRSLHMRFELLLAVGGLLVALPIVALTKGRLGYPRGNHPLDVVRDGN